MRKYPAILLAVLLLLAACSAEIVDNLPARDVEKASETASVIAGGNSLTVSFSPVAYAKGYGYKLTGGSYTQITSPEYADGKITFTVTDVKDNIGDIYIYAESASGTPVEIAHSSYALSLDGVAPDVYISERGSNFVILRTSHEDRTSIIYKVQLGSNEPQYFPYVGVMKIDGLDSGLTYTATVSHSLDGEVWSDKTTTVTIPIFGGSKTDIDFHITDDVLTASGITGDSVELYKKTEYTQEGEGTLLKTVSVSDGNASVAASELKSLESGYFYFKSGEVYSNVIKYTTPATVKDVTPNWRSAELEIDFANDFSENDYTITVSGAGRNSTATVTDTGLKIDGLDSNTSYDDVTISFRKSDSLGSTSSSTAIKTKSFAGTYQWEGKFKGESDTVRFRIIVSDDVREGSESPYYVYFDTTAEIGDSIINSKDKNGNSYVDQTLRIMPIVDYNVESGGNDSKNPVKTDAPGDLSNQNKAYLANSSKWNPMSSSSLGQVKSWYISNPDTDSARDKVVTETVSEAGMTANMQTSFEFREAEIGESIVPVVKFKNKAIGSSAFLINNFLYQNSDSSTQSRFGDTTETEGKYCWYLEKVEEV